MVAALGTRVAEVTVVGVGAPDRRETTVTPMVATTPFAAAEMEVMPVLRPVASPWLVMATTDGLAEAKVKLTELIGLPYWSNPEAE
jgi:hypothetical protein